MEMPILIRRFDDLLSQRPDQVVFEADSYSCTRRELDRESRRLTAFFSQRPPPGIRAPRIAILLEDPYKYLAAMIGAMRAGVTYIPLSPSWPMARILEVLERTQPDWILHAKGNLSGLENRGSQGLVIDYSTTVAEFPEPPKETVRAFPQNSISHIIFTSGSTSEPKAVQIPYRALNQYAENCEVLLGDRKAHQQMLAFHDFTFDMSAMAWTLMLLGRGTVHFLPAKAGVLDLIRYIEAKRITFLTGVPSTFALLRKSRRWINPGGFSSLQVICSAGAILFANLLRDLWTLAPNAEIINLYGPTETMIWCSLFATRRSHPPQGASLPIGQPSPGTFFIFATGESGFSASPGKEGELLIGGHQLMSGYLGDRDRGLRNVKWQGQSVEVYASGDYFTENEGEFYFLGRKSGFLKTSGYRVSPLEIEQSYTQFPRITECAVVGIPDLERETAIVLFYSADKRIPDCELIEFGKEKILQHSLPHFIYFLSVLPKTQSRKTDYPALQAMARDLSSVREN